MYALGTDNFADAMARATAIKSTGARDNPDGTTTVQMAKRSAQMEGIYTCVTNSLNDAVRTRDTYNKGGEIVVADGIVRQILGYMNTVGRVAEELKAAGK